MPLFPAGGRCDATAFVINMTLFCTGFDVNSTGANDLWKFSTLMLELI